MGLFPKIQSPCPYKGNLGDVMDGDICRLCKREVTDLTALGDDERIAFFSACRDDKVCVTYSLPVLAAAAMGASLIASSASAGDMVTEVVITGGVHPAKVEFVSRDAAVTQAAATSSAELPVVYDAKPSAPDATAKPADAAPPAKSADAPKPAQ